MKLYQITEQYQNIAELLQDPEFADNPDILNALDQIEDDFNHKVEQTIFIMRNLQAEIEPIDAEIKRLQAMKKARSNNVDRIKERLKANLKATGLNKVKCGLFSVSYAEREKSAVELNEDLFLANNLDESLVTVKISPNKTAIKKALESGVEVIGAELISSEVLTIR